MTANEFRKLALSLPQAVEQSHMDHPDFRVGGRTGGKIFATLGHPANKSAMVKLKPIQQQELIARHPTIFQPVKGGWGERGATTVKLAGAKEEIVRSALVLAWKNIAPKKLVKEFANDLDAE